MNIHFIYKKNTFNFNVKKDVSISYLKKLVSKVIEKDKSDFDLFYNNKIISEKIGTLSEIEDSKKNLTIIITLKRNKNKDRSSRNTKLIKLPLLTISNRLNAIKTENDVKNNIYSNNSDDSNSSLEDLNQYMKTNKLNSRMKAFQKKNNYISQNTVFEDVYNGKEEEIINLMKDLKNKILEYDDALYKNCKNSWDNDNSQLLLFEKNIINYKDNQLKLLKKLINYFGKKESSFFSKGKISINEFYLELSKYNSNQTISYIQNDFSKKRKKNIKSNLKLTSFIQKKVSISNRVSEDSIYNDEIIKEKIDKYSRNKKPSIIKINKSATNNTKQNINNFDIGGSLEKINKKVKVQELEKNNLTNPENNIILTNKENQENKDNQVNKENQVNQQNQENQVNQVEPKNKDNQVIQKNKENQVNQVSQKNKENQVNKKIQENQEKQENFDIKSHSSKSINIIKEEKDEIKSLDKNKINVLFDNASNEEEDEDPFSESDSSMISLKGKKNMARLEENLRERKRTLKSIDVKNFKIGYKVKIKDKQKNHKLKKLGNNISDFVI